MDAPPGAADVGAGPTYLSLAAVVENTEFLRSIEPPIWSDSWLVITTTNNPLVMRCGEGFD